MTRALPRALALVAAACTTEAATQIVVVIDSDLTVPTELDELRIRVLDATGEVATDRVVRLGPGEGEFSLPTDFGVAPRDPDAGDPVRIEVQARLEGETLFEAHAVTAFVKDHQLRLDLMLSRACVGAAPCGPDMTCVAGSCAEAFVDPASLVEFEP